MAAIEEIYEAARQFMYEHGNRTQWNGAYPGRELIERDLRTEQLFVCEVEHVVHGVFTFSMEPEPVYAVMEEGHWRNEQTYGTIHRLASDGAVSGIAKACIDYCKSRTDNLRADTHMDNHIMRSLLEQNEFIYCGKVYMRDHSMRLAYHFVGQELLDVVDEQGNPTGEVIDRKKAHERGIRHRTAHVWLLRKKGAYIQVLLQKRSQGKDSNPGCYDISSAGHITAGVDYVTSALRELKEELNVDAKPQDLIYCGQRHFFSRHEFYGHPFLDNQVSNVYLMWLDQEPEDFILQTEEVESVTWFDFTDCVNQVCNHTIPNCIQLEELEMLREHI